MLSFLRRKPALPGSIWLDEPGAHKTIEAKARRGVIADEEAANLRKFADDGYFVTRLDLSPAQAGAIDDDVDRLWRERPHNISFAYDSPPLRFSQADERSQRRPRYRIHDLHAVSETARRIYLDSSLSRYASLILDEQSVATQSLYFEYGSQQALHRDSVVVPTPILGQLLASWTALEDIDPRSGALVYVPGSHKLPYFEFAAGEYVYDPSRMGESDVRAAMAFYDQTLAASGLQTRTFAAKSGEVLIWHSALLHGGGPVADESLTRKSFVVHYSALAHHAVRHGAVSEVIDGTPGESVYATNTILESGSARGFDNALDGQFLYRR
jgi:Phytanoyl-CoA dioxygenase (PhyH)